MLMMKEKLAEGCSQHISRSTSNRQWERDLLALEGKELPPGGDFVLWASGGWGLLGNVVWGRWEEVEGFER